MGERIVKTYVNRKREDNGDNVVLISNSQTGKCKRVDVKEGANTREYMTYLLACDLQELDLFITEHPEAGYYNQYVFIINKTMVGLANETTRQFYIENKTTASKFNPKPLTNNFISYVNLIQYVMTKLKNQGAKVRIVDDKNAIPHEYNGEKYGSVYYEKLISETWKMLDTLVKPRENKEIKFEIE